MKKKYLFILLIVFVCASIIVAVFFVDRKIQDSGEIKVRFEDLPREIQKPIEQMMSEAFVGAAKQYHIDQGITDPIEQEFLWGMHQATGLNASDVHVVSIYMVKAQKNEDQITTAEFTELEFTTELLIRYMRVHADVQQPFAIICVHKNDAARSIRSEIVVRYTKEQGWAWPGTSPSRIAGDSSSVEGAGSPRPTD